MGDAMYYPVELSIFYDREVYRGSLLNMDALRFDFTIGLLYRII